MNLQYGTTKCNDREELEGGKERKHNSGFMCLAFVFSYQARTTIGNGLLLLYPLFANFIIIITAAGGIRKGIRIMGILCPVSAYSLGTCLKLD